MEITIESHKYCCYLMHFNSMCMFRLIFFQFFYFVRAVKSRLEGIWKGSLPVNNVEAILIDLSCYKNNDLVRNSLKLLITIHSHDETLFSHTAHTQLLVAEESLADSNDLQSLLPTLRHLLSVDCYFESQQKIIIIDILEKLTIFCTRADDEEPHADNQMLLYNHG